MSSDLWMSLASATVFLAVAVVAVVRRAQSRLAVYLALHSIGLFTYTALDVISALAEQAWWDWLEDLAAALALVPGIALVVGFMGMSRRLRWFVRAVAAYFGTLALCSLGAFVAEPLRSFTGGTWWALAMLAGVALAYGAAALFLLRHAVRSKAEERARCQLMLGAVLIGVGSPATDLVSMAGGSIPRLSFAGLLAHSLLIAALVLKTRFFEKVTVLTIVNALVVAVLAVAAQLAVFALAGARPGLFVLGSVIVVLSLTAALRPLWRTLAEQRARITYHATLGRMAAQMAHDIRNPVAAIRGAAQFLKEEQAQGRPLEPHESFLDLIVERTERLERVVGDYQRMARVEPLFERTDILRLIHQVLEGSQVAAQSHVQVVTELPPELPELVVDGDLLACALENIVRNALEAMAEGGTLTVSAALVSRREDGAEAIVLRVQDTGEGMNVRVRERALDEFFTTKSEGSGLGLAFVARVAEAHGGQVTLASEPGEGATIELELPRQPAAR